MDQIILVIAGTMIAVRYILSPVKLVHWFLGKLERLGGTAGTISEKAHKARSYYVRSHK